MYLSMSAMLLLTSFGDSERASHCHRHGTAAGGGTAWPGVMAGTGGVSPTLGTMVITAGAMTHGSGGRGDMIHGSMILGITTHGGLIRGTGLLMGIIQTIGHLSRGFLLTEGVIMGSEGARSRAARKAEGRDAAIIVRE